MVVGIVSAGAMGSAVGGRLRDGGARVVTTLAGRSPRTRRLAEAEGLDELPSLEDVVAAAGIVLSVVPPGEAVAAAEQIAAAARGAGAAPLVADLNAVSPATVTSVAAALAPLDLVDGAITGPPPDGTDRTRVYLSG